MQLTKKLSAILILLLIASCATYNLQVKESEKDVENNTKKIAHTFYLVGDAGNSSLQKKSKGLTFLENKIDFTDKKSTLIFLGDNVYEKGIPKKNSTTFADAKHKLDAQLSIAKKFDGTKIFIPGNHDWYSGLSGLKSQEKMVEEALGKNTFLPENGCPIDKVEIGKDIIVIIIDTQWYLTDWDKHPTINDNCEIKTRTKFFDEFEGLIKKSRGKTTIVAMHHPMFTNGPHGGKYSFGSHFSPTPVLGTFKNLIRKTSGISNTDLQNKHYNELKKHLVTIAQENEKTIFVSGHEHSLQYIVKDNLPQIVSGSGSKTSPTKLTDNAKFTYGAEGFAKLLVFTDGSSKVEFYAAANDSIVYETKIFNADEKKSFTTYPKFTYSEKKASVYTQQEVTKSGFYRFLWGERYRKYFGTEITAPTVNLDTLFGGLAPVRKGGGHQSKSLRLKDKKGREYVMRAIRKNAVQYLQAVAFKDQYIEGQFDDTAVEALLMDVFTGSHPYAPFTIGTLSDAIGVLHTNPVLYYVPKQNSLGNFNDEFGDELYMIEERADSGFGDKASFGFSNELISTDEMLKKINEDEDYIVDEQAYIKARLFDMLIGDWDRHEDQWRWAEFKENGKTIYRPMPRDRDQAFSIMGDGALLGFATNAAPPLRLMRAYEEELESPEWFSLEPYPLDMAIITQANKELWDTTALYIQNNITDAVIDKAFENFPKEVQDETIQTIKRKLIGRRANLKKISDQYFAYMNQFVIVKGTQKDDFFEIERLANGNTKIIGYRIKKGEKADIFHQKEYVKDVTKEIWIYGLDDDDTFVVKGDAKDVINIKIIGGQNKDTYTIENTKKVKVYDYKSKESIFTTKGVNKRLTDDYETNIYNYKKLKSSINLINPKMWFNPDDGIKLGLEDAYTVNGFERNPFSSQHIFSGFYYFATSGFELNYNGTFARVVGDWNLNIDATFTSPNFAINFFGFGNNTVNPAANGKNEMNEMDFNRIKIRQYNVGTSLQKVGNLGAILKLGINYQNYKVDYTAGRIVTTAFAANDPIFTSQQFINTEASYHFENADNAAFPTNGMETDLKLGYTTNLTNSNHFGYLIPSISFNQKISSNGKLVFATKIHSHFTFGDDYEFYQAASIGGNKFGLRGFRNQRFTDKNAFYHSSDIRLNLKKLKTSLVPIDLGIFGGFDYGKVWGNNTSNSDILHTSYGGGFFFTAANMIGANLALFNSTDGTRLAISLGFKF